MFSPLPVLGAPSSRSLIAQGWGIERSSTALPMPDPQLQALHAYTLLTALRPSWPGALILSLGLTPDACSIPFAALVAGAACLAIEPDPTICRAAMRTGACDFIVNTIDEALRILKNEIRQRKPISVGVESPIEPALAELRERGVLPRLFVDPTGLHQPLGPALSDPAAGESLAAANGWTLHAFSFETSAALRAFDTRQQSLISVEDPRHPWLTTAPRLFPRDRTRHLYLTPSELEQLPTKNEQRRTNN